MAISSLYRMGEMKTSQLPFLLQLVCQPFRPLKFFYIIDFYGFLFTQKTILTSGRTLPRTAGAEVRTLFVGFMQT
ncbi:hypothetical protein VI06_00950 [Aquitalea magnusonii]|nr:hypothetical protein VI06_00950 [Aquitalea magnusonii]